MRGSTVGKPHLSITTQVLTVLCYPEITIGCEAKGIECLQNLRSQDWAFSDQYNGPDCYRRTGYTYKNNRRTTVDRQS